MAEAQDRADRDPPGLRRRAGRARRGATRTSSRSTPTSRSPPSRSSSASSSPSASSTVGAAEASMMSMSLRARRHRQGPLRLDLRDLRHRALLRPGPAGDRPQRAQGPDRRQPRRRLAGRGRRLPPDDRGHRADAGDAEDAGGRPRRLQPGLPRRSIESYEREEPMYMRFGRPATPIVYDEIPETLGNGVDVLREGKDISIFACGHMVWRGARGRRRRSSARTASRPRWSTSRSSSRSTPRRVLNSLAKTGVAVTAEEHRVVGGLADAVREVAAEQHPVPIFALGMEDEFGVSGTGRGLHGALRPHRVGHRRPRPRGPDQEADRLAPAACTERS